MKHPLLSAAALAGAVASSVSIASAQIGWAITGSSQLVSFDLLSPSSFLSSSALSGLRSADGVSLDPFGNLQDIAFANGQLYGIDGNANVYSINTGSGAATLLSSGLAPLGYSSGFAYDPFTGGFRFVTDLGENFTIALDGSSTAAPTTFFAPGDTNSGTPSFSGLAIDTDFGTAYALDAERDVLAVSVDPNVAEFFTIGSLGLDVSGLAALDFLGGSTIYAALSDDAATSSLYGIDISTGLATQLGAFNETILAMALSAAPTPSPVPEPSTYGALAGAAAILLAALRRRRKS